MFSDILANFAAIDIICLSVDIWKSSKLTSFLIELFKLFFCYIGDMMRRVLIFIMILLTVDSLAAMENNGLQGLSSSDTIIVSNKSVNVNDKSEDLISRNLFVEFGGPSFGVGVGYDQRFRPNSVFGFRTGVSFTSGSWDDSGWFGSWDGGSYTNVDFKGVTFPLELNAIMGGRASKFELGIGATPCILHRHETTYGGCHPAHSGIDVKDGVRLNIFGAINIGYRLQRRSGFFLRAGFTFLIGDLKCSPMDGLILIPNLALGYTIR